MPFFRDIISVKPDVVAPGRGDGAARLDDAMGSNFKLGGEIRISLSKENDRIALLSVSDTGVGMPADVMNRIFEPFFTTKTEGRGTGLGLATVKRIVDDAGGTIGVDSAPGEGAVFHVRLPLAEDRAAEKSALESNLPHALFPANIVLLDDNAMVRQTTRAMLEHAGHRVTEGKTGHDGIPLILEQAGIDLILSDVVMPEMGGVELLDEMRARGINVPVILMTGYADPDLDLDAVAHASDVLRKPVRQVELLRKVNEVLERASHI